MKFTRLEFLLLLPILLSLFVLKVRRRKHYFGISILLYLKDKIPKAPILVHLPNFLQSLALVFLFLAVLNPVLISTEHQEMIEGLDIALVLDVSSSMQEYIKKEEDFEATASSDIQNNEQTKLEVVKNAMIDFIKRRLMDRIGLIVFSENAYIVTPQTVDYRYLIQYIRMIDSKTLFGETLTSIGEGISTASELLTRQKDRKNKADKVIIVFSDAEQNYGLNLFSAIKHAQDMGYRIYLIGIDIWQKEASKKFLASLVEAIETTGGKYFDARNVQQLKKAYLEIDSLAKGSFLIKRSKREVPFYSPFVLISLIMLSVSIGLRVFPYFIEIASTTLF